MSTSTTVSTCALPPRLVWQRLVNRSINAWETLAYREDRGDMRLAREFLQDCASLDAMLSRSPGYCMFWFFQLRQSFLLQRTMTKWNRDRLEDYVLLPGMPFYINRRDCFFVSHFWRQSDDPDPDGKYLRRLQRTLRPQQWSYVWVDWTCIPQHPRSVAEGNYFVRALAMMPSVIRNCGFAWHYPPFEPRMWILYEIAEYTLTASGPFTVTKDVAGFFQHIQLMSSIGVQPVLHVFKYKCSYERDTAYLTSQLEFLVLLIRLHINGIDRRRLVEISTWNPTIGSIYANTQDGPVEVRKFEGTLSLNGEIHTLTPFPILDYKTFFEYSQSKNKRISDGSE